MRVRRFELSRELPQRYGYDPATNEQIVNVARIDWVTAA